MMMQHAAAAAADSPSVRASLQTLQVLHRSSYSNSLFSSSICEQRTAAKTASSFPKRKLAAAAVQCPCGEQQEESRSSSPGTGFAERLCRISELYAEVGEYEKRQAEEYVAMAEAEGGRRAEDYERRAFLYGKSGEMGVASKRKREKVAEEMEELRRCNYNLVQLMMEEEDDHERGNSPADYQRRALFFTKTAQVFGPSL